MFYSTSGPDSFNKTTRSGQGKSLPYKSPLHFKAL